VMQEAEEVDGVLRRGRIEMQTSLAGVLEIP